MQTIERRYKSFNNKLMVFDTRFYKLMESTEQKFLTRPKLRSAKKQQKAFAKTISSAEKLTKDKINYFSLGANSLPKGIKINKFAMQEDQLRVI